jgi:2-cysteine adaptor domain
MDITKAQCEAFKKNPSVNPVTGRAILIGNVTHKKLVKACEGVKKTPSPKSIPKRDPPPMGPMIHWAFGADNYLEEFNNMTKFARYISKRVKETDGETGPLSLMELNEIQAIIKEAKVQFKDEPAYIQGLNKINETVLDLLKRTDVVNDLPVSTVVAYLEIKPSRISVREGVMRCHQLWQDALEDMQISIEKNKVFAHVFPKQIQNLLEQKAYLDYVIKHKIFSADDIYQRTFKMEKPYEHLKALFKKYSALFKKLEGKSP